MNFLNYPFFYISLQELGLFLQQGGLILSSIALLSCLMWLLILERYYFLFWQYPNLSQHVQRHWLSRAEHGSWYAQRIRAGLLGKAQEDLQKYLCLLRVLPQILLLLGLLGTVDGMISIFSVLNFTQANPRNLADGISQALLTTMAGLLTALPGIYFSSALHKRARWELQKLADLLTFD